MAYSPLAALDDRPRPGKEPTITPEAKAWLVSLACEKAEDHGYPHELWTTRLLARHARENAPAAGHESLGNLVQARCARFSPRGSQAAQGAVLSGTSRRRVRQKMAEVLCVYREVQVLKKAAKSKKPGKPVAIVSLLARHDLLTGKVHALVRDRHRCREFIEFLKLLEYCLSGQHRDQVDPQQSFRAHLPRNQSLARHWTTPSLRVHVHAPNTAPGSTYRLVCEECGMTFDARGSGSELLLGRTRARGAGRIWEPGCGLGAIFGVLRGHNPRPLCASGGTYDVSASARQTFLPLSIKSPFLRQLRFFLLQHRDYPLHLSPRRTCFSFASSARSCALTASPAAAVWARSRLPSLRSVGIFSICVIFSNARHVTRSSSGARVSRSAVAASATGSSCTIAAGLPLDTANSHEAFSCPNASVAARAIQARA